MADTTVINKQSGQTLTADEINNMGAAINSKVDKVNGSRLITASEANVLSQTSGSNSGDQDISNLVVKVPGKGLSTNDYDATEKQKNSDNAAAITAEITNRQNADTAVINQLVDNAPTALNTVGKLAARLNALISVVEGTTPDADNIVNTIQEVLAVFANYPEGVTISDALSGKLNKTDLYTGTDQTVTGKAADATVIKTLNDALNLLNTALGNETTNRQNADATKVDKIGGKGLSTNDYDNTAAAKLNALSGFNPTDYANSKFFETANGLYDPVLTAGGFDNPTANTTNGLATHASGGVIAAVAGTTGQGNMYLPVALDPSKAFLFSILIEINDAQPLTFAFQNAGADFRTGFRATSISTGGISGDAAGGTLWANSYGSTGGIPAGTKVWFNLVSDGQSGVFINIIPYTTPTGYSFSVAPAFNSAFNQGAYGINFPNNFQYSTSGVNAFGGTGSQFKNRLCRLNITTKSTASRIIGVWVNQGLGGPSDGQLQPPSFFKTTILQDTSAIVFKPAKQGYLPVDLLMLNHQNAYGVEANWGVGSAAGIALGKIVQAGYLCFGLDGLYGGTSLTGAEATCSNWGAATGMRYRKAFWDWIRANIPGTRKVYEWGLSMGFLNSLRLSIEYPSQIAGIIGTGGVCDLTDCFNNRGFNATINKSFSTWYAAIQTNTGVKPDQVVNISTAATSGATSLAVTALAAQIPSGTVLTLQSGTGPVSVVTTALAASGATTLAVSAIGADIAVSSKFDMSAYWQQISYGFGAPELAYYSSPYVWKDLWTNISVAATAASGATSVTVSALPFDIPAGTVLVLSTGTGPATVTVTTVVKANNTTLTVSALSSGITNGAKYDFPFALNTVVGVSNITGTAKTYQFADPVLNGYRFSKIPVAIWHGDSDALIPIAQATNFKSVVEAAGGAVQLTTVAGGTHLGASTFDGDGIVTWLNAR